MTAAIDVDAEPMANGAVLKSRAPMSVSLANVEISMFGPVPTVAVQTPSANVSEMVSAAGESIAARYQNVPIPSRSVRPHAARKTS